MISRRTFLGMAGITLVGAQFRPAFDLLQKPADTPVLGRTLTPTFLTAPDFTRSTLLSPDTVLPLLALDSMFYHVPGGVVTRDSVQPMMPVDIPLPHPVPTYWAEVIAPSAPVRRSCTPDSQSVAYIGHGGTAHVIDRLDNWLGLANEQGNFLGWSPIERWQPAINLLHPAKNGHIEINLRQRQFIAYENGEPVLETPMTFHHSLTPQRLQIKERRIASFFDRYHGIPWTIHFEGQGMMCGVNWHNNFGRHTIGPTVQLPLLAARWLYAWIADDTRIEVVS